MPRRQVVQNRQNAHHYRGRFAIIKVRAYNETSGKHYSWRIPRAKAARDQFLAMHQMFQCAKCKLYVSWDFGAAVGVPDLKPLPFVGKTFRTALPLDSTPAQKKLYRFDDYLRECCDSCWGTLTKGSHAQSREAI